MTTGCTSYLKNFSLYRPDNRVETNIFAIAGIYYRVIPPYQDNQFQNEPHVDSFILYSNGTYFDYSFYQFDPKDTSSYIKSIERFDSYEKTYPSVHHWGAYEILGDTIHIQYFVSYKWRTNS
jgi:hypothetical protein